MRPDVRLFSSPISHYCVSAERMLSYKRVPFERVPVRYDDRAEVERVTGQDYVPALVWDGRTVPWSKIPEFLDLERPDPPLVVPEWAGVARVLEAWGHEVVEATVWPAVVTEVPRLLSDERERWVFEEMQSRSRGPFARLRSREPEFVRAVREVFARIDALVVDREWVLGDPSVADFGIFGGLAPWWLVGRKIPTRFRHLARWVDRVARIPDTGTDRRGRRTSGTAGR